MYPSTVARPFRPRNGANECLGALHAPRGSCARRRGAGAALEDRLSPFWQLNWTASKKKKNNPCMNEFESRSSAACTSLRVAKVGGRSRALAPSIHEGRHLEVKLLFPALHHTARPPSHRAVQMLACHINPLSGRAALVGRLAQPPRQCASPVAQTHQQPQHSALQLLDSPRLAPRRH